MTGVSMPTQMINRRVDFHILNQNIFKIKKSASC